MHTNKLLIALMLTTTRLFAILPGGCIVTKLNRSRVAVFCSADDKVASSYKLLAHNLGQQLGTHNFGLITGGSRTGLMKEVTDGYVAKAKNTKDLYGVLPKALLEYDIHHRAIHTDNLLWVNTMHTRLAHFHSLADAIIVLPGGFGTLHELMDFLVHNQFALSKTPIILINPDGYWDHLLALFQHMINSKTLVQKHMATLCVLPSTDECIKKLMIHSFNFTEQGFENHYWKK